MKDFTYLDLDNLPNEKVSTIKSVMEIYPDSMFAMKCAVKEVARYDNEDLEKYPELNEAIDKANNIAVKYFGTDFKLIKEIKSKSAVSKVKKIAKKYGVLQSKQKESKKEFEM